MFEKEVDTMELDMLIKSALNEAADETSIPKEKKVDLLLDVLTTFLQSKVGENNSVKTADSDEA